MRPSIFDWSAATVGADFKPRLRGATVVTEGTTRRGKNLTQSRANGHDGQAEGHPAGVRRIASRTRTSPTFRCPPESSCSSTPAAQSHLYV
jgi:hypothetical protein